jgi:hypothetical protein
MGRPEEPFDRDGSPVREFAFWLRDLRRQSGLTYEQLAAKANYAVSTVQAAAAGQRLPTLLVTLAVVRACDGDQRAWQAYWTQIRRLLDDDAPPSMSRSVAPPWAAAVPAPDPHPASGPAPVAASDSAGPAPVAASASAGSVSASVSATSAPAGAGSGAGEPDGWYTESLVTVVRVDGERPEVIERRTVVATADGLGEIVSSLNVPRHPEDLDRPAGLESELLYGGSLERREQPYDSYFRNVIVLPRPLRAGERHEYGLRLRIPPGQRMATHYLHIPFRRSDHFDLRVRFRPDRPPRTVWLLRGVPMAVIYQQEPAADTLDPDRFGEVHASFRDMRPGLAYGIRWRESER